jgi:tRNA A-37 threonylcarbamoyl transferase component Bud32
MRNAIKSLHEQGTAHGDLRRARNILINLKSLEIKFIDINLLFLEEEDIQQHWHNEDERALTDIDVLEARMLPEAP